MMSCRDGTLYDLIEAMRVSTDEQKARKSLLTTRWDRRLNRQYEKVEVFKAYTLG